MSAEWHAGVLTSASWHRLESIQEMKTAIEMIAAGRSSGAWPVQIRTDPIYTEDGLPVPGRAVVGVYQDGAEKAFAAVSDGWSPLPPEEWAKSIEDAVEAGAKPSGAFALRGGARIIATFEIEDDGGFRNYLFLGDSMDRSMAFTVGGTSIRVVCANTMALFKSCDGHKAGKARHTRGISAHAVSLREAMVEHIESGRSVRDLYNEVESTHVDRLTAYEVFDQLFPRPEPQMKKVRDENGEEHMMLVPLSDRKKASMEKRRQEALQAMEIPENQGHSTLATIWNAATYLVDRRLDGSLRGRSEDQLIESMLFGTRGKRIEEIRNVIQVVMADGSIEELTVPEAKEHGIDDAQIGRQLLEEMI